MSLEIKEQEVNKQEVQPSKNNERLIVVLLIVLFLVMFSSGFLVYKLVLAKSFDAENATIKIGPIYETEEFVVNFSGSVKHYLKAQFALELSDKKVIKELEEKKPLLQDTINMILLNQTTEVLTSEGREELKENLIKSINEFLDKGSVEKIHCLVFLLT